MSKVLNLTIVTQEKELANAQVVSVRLMTSEGEVTILPGHIPLFTKLADGELIAKTASETLSFAISGGFLDVSPKGDVVILADHAIRSDDINVAMAEEARQKAQEALHNQQSQRDFMLAEASLRQALNELKIANRRRRSSGL